MGFNDVTYITSRFIDYYSEKLDFTNPKNNEASSSCLVQEWSCLHSPLKGRYRNSQVHKPQIPSVSPILYVLLISMESEFTCVTTSPLSDLLQPLHSWSTQRSPQLTSTGQTCMTCLSYMTSRVYQ